MSGNDRLENQKERTLSDLQSQHPADVAEYLTQIEGIEEKTRFFLLLSTTFAAKLMGHLNANVQDEIIEAIDNETLVLLLAEMPPDERADTFNRIEKDRQRTLKRFLKKTDRENLIKLSSYPDRSAGSVMTTEFSTLDPEITVAQAIAKIKNDAPRKETIYESFVVDPFHKILGVVSLRDLLVAESSHKISDLMTKEVIFGRVLENQEEIARRMAKYDLLAIPILNGGDRLAGIVTHDDMIDIIQREATEDVEKFMAISPTPAGQTYLSTPSLEHFKRRVWWVVGLAAAGLISGIIIHSFENALASMMILALYMPMVADTGGNTGSQAATVVVRSLALGEIKTKDALRVLWKELKISVSLAGILGFIAYAKVLWLSRTSEIPLGFSLEKIAFAISIALGLQVITATLVGAFLPLLAHRFKLDPAVVASPALTTIVDITGLLIYFKIAQLVLGFN